VGAAFVPTRIATVQAPAWANKKPFAHPTSVKVHGEQSVPSNLVHGTMRIRLYVGTAALERRIAG